MNSQIISQHKNLVYKIALKYSKYYDLEDLFQAGMIGIMKALRNYKKDSPAKFSTYAYSYILGEILDFIKGNRSIKVGAEVIKLYKSYQKGSEYLTQKLERTPSFKEICDFLEISESDMFNCIASCEFTTSLDKCLSEEENYYNFVGDDKREEIDALLCLKNEVSQLPKQEQKIIIYRYYKDYTQSETAAELGISQVQVSRQEKLILSKIKENMFV